MSAVALRRSRLKIPHPNPSARRWSAEERALLGRMPDKGIAYELGLEVKQVRAQRERLRIPVFDRQLHQWTRAEDARLGKERDEVLAKAFGITVTAIKHRRTRLGIFLSKKLRRPKRTQRPWTPAELALLGQVNDREIAWRTGRCDAIEPRVAPKPWSTPRCARWLPSPTAESRSRRSQ